MKEETLLIDIAKKTLDSIRADRLIKKKIRFSDGKFISGDVSIELDDYGEIYVIGFGKASAMMAKPIVEWLGERVTDGWVNVKYGHAIEIPEIRIWECGHPLPDENTIKGTREILRMVRNSGRGDLIIALISGGGSALFEDPMIPLEDMIKTNELLLKSGASIHEINTVRKHLSGVKGGRLAKIAEPSKVFAIVLSDVIGDDLSTIASGPLSPDNTSFSDAFAVLERYQLWNVVPESVRNLIKRGLKGLIEETPDRIENVKTIVVGNLRDAMKEAVVIGKKKVHDVILREEFVECEAREAGKLFAEMAENFLRDSRLKNPVLVIAGGETTVTVTGDGKGGRNQELALAFAIYAKGLNAWILGVNTDGTDGPTDAAGAIASGKTYMMALNSGLVPEKYIENNDSYTFFEKVGGLFKTGPTHTNLNDLIFLYVKPEE